MLLQRCPLTLVFTSLLLILTGLFGAELTEQALAANGSEQAPPEFGIHLSLPDQLHVYRKVVLLPLLDENGHPDVALSEALADALHATQKYSLLPLKAGLDWLTLNQSGAEPLSELALRAGRNLAAGGVIAGRVQARRKLLPVPGASQQPLICSIQMTDLRSEEQIWELEIPLPSTGINSLPIMNRAIEELVKALVAEGDIFSPLIPQPRILSRSGLIRSVRIVLQPAPPHIHSAYLLMRASSREGEFQPINPPVANDTAPLVLTDQTLDDGRTYYYTVVGINKFGLASIPELPFTVTTTGLPAAVTELHAAGNGLRQIQLSWAPSQDPDVNGYNIYRSIASTGPFTRIFTVNDPEQQSFTDRGEARSFDRYGRLTDDTVYYYVIRTRNVVDVESEDSAVASARTKGKPEAPSKLRATDRQPRSIPLSWIASPDPHTKGYAIFRSMDGSEPFVQIAFVDGREVQDFVDMGTWNSSLADDTRYFYQVRAVNVVDLQSDPSETVSATTKAAPRAVTGLATENGLLRAVTVHWLSSPEPDVAEYRIFRGNGEDSTTEQVGLIHPPGTSFTDRNLEDGRTYWYRVQAVDRDRLESSLSIAVSGSTKPKPSQPSGVEGEVVDNGILLKWQANPEPDIQRYEIFTTGFLAHKIGETDALHILLREDFEAGKEYSYQVRAVDRDLLMSPLSETVLVTIPGQP